MVQNEPVAYRGIDFVLKSRKAAAPLIKALEQCLRVNQHMVGSRLMVLNLLSSKLSPDAEITAFCDLIDGLPPTAKRCWKACHARIIDIGIDSGRAAQGQPFQPLELAIDPELLTRAGRLGCSIMITVYPSVSRYRAKAIPPRSRRDRI